MCWTTESYNVSHGYECEPPVQQTRSGARSYAFALTCQYLSSTVQETSHLPLSLYGEGRSGSFASACEEQSVTTIKTYPT
jgi:hypothetical protein